MSSLLFVSLAAPKPAPHALAGLTAAGWTIMLAEAALIADAARGQRHALVLLDGEPEHAATVARSVRESASAVPVLLLGSRHACESAPFDAVVDQTTLDGGLTGWWPLAPDPVRERLATMLGQASYADLAARFGEQLNEALAATMRDGASPGVAHRIAGLAGTLGFAEVSSAWLPLAEGAGDAPALAAAGTAARRALQVIAHMPRPTI